MYPLSNWDRAWQIVSYTVISAHWDDTPQEVNVSITGQGVRLSDVSPSKGKLTTTQETAYTPKLATF